VEEINNVSLVIVRAVCNEGNEENSRGSFINVVAKSMTNEKAREKDRSTSSNNTGKGRNTNNKRTKTPISIEISILFIGNKDCGLVVEDIVA
jgi:hypothetical protein